MLYIVATPIGNLQDITLRALETLKLVDGVLCEDSRRTSLLLNHFGIKKPLMVINDYNETKILPQVISQLKEGKHLALVSDAGTPLISDPGFKLIREIIREGLEVDSIPGPSAIITALTLSGLATDKFLFHGYLPDKVGHRQKALDQIKQINKISPMTHILYVAPFKLGRTLAEVMNSFGDIELTLAAELTKIHQSVKTQKISSWLEHFQKQNPKGEWVMLLRV